MNDQSKLAQSDLLKIIADQKAMMDKMAAALEQAQKPKAITMKVSEKGALSIYGLGRFPITLYRSQIERLLDHAPQIREFIKANDTLLAVKA